MPDAKTVATNVVPVAPHRYIVMTAANTLPLSFVNLLSKHEVPVLTKHFDADGLLAQVANAADFAYVTRIATDSA